MPTEQVRRPTLVVLNRAGQVAMYHPGALSYDQLHAALQKVVGLPQMKIRRRRLWGPPALLSLALAAATGGASSVRSGRLPLPYRARWELGRPWLRDVPAAAAPGAPLPDFIRQAAFVSAHFSGPCSERRSAASGGSPFPRPDLCATVRVGVGFFGRAVASIGMAGSLTPPQRGKLSTDVPVR